MTPKEIQEVETGSISGSPSEKRSGKSAAKKKPSKAQELAKKSKALIEKYNSRQSREVGSVIGGDPLYHYTWVGETSKTQDVVQRLLDLGYEEEPDSGVRFSGIVGGRVFRIPLEVKEFYRSEREKRYRKRAGVRR